MSPPKIKEPFALKEILFKALFIVPIEFVIDKLLEVEKLMLPYGVVDDSELRVLLESTIKKPAPVKFTILLVKIEEEAVFDESIVVVAERADRL
jgi:hypothetical protein